MTAWIRRREFITLLGGAASAYARLAKSDADVAVAKVSAQSWS
jgi:hypothetical protein